MKRQIRDKEISQDDLNDFVEPIQTELNQLNIKLLDLHELIFQRHLLHHQSIHSAVEQKTFIEFLEQYEFSDKFSYRTLVENMIRLLKTDKLKRFKGSFYHDNLISVVYSFVHQSKYMWINTIYKTQSII
jgi:hypothetical protein